MEMSRDFPDWSKELLVSLAVNDQGQTNSTYRRRKLVGIKVLEGGRPEDDNGV